jgi:hypothetical protein
MVERLCALKYPQQRADTMSRHIERRGEQMSGLVHETCNRGRTEEKTTPCIRRLEGREENRRLLCKRQIL